MFTVKIKTDSVELFSGMVEVTILDGSFGGGYIPDDPESYWWRAIQKTETMILSVDEYDNVVFHNRWYPRITIRLHKLKLIKKTPKGVWLEDDIGDYGDWLFEPKKRFVLREANKRFACPTRREAVESLLARTSRRVKILSSQLKAARIAKDGLEAMMNGGYSEW